MQDEENLKLQLSNDLISKDELNKKDDLLKSKDGLIKIEKEKSNKIIEGNGVVVKSKNEMQKKLEEELNQQKAKIKEKEELLQKEKEK